MEIKQAIVILKNWARWDNLMGKACKMAIAALEQQQNQCGERKCGALSGEWIEHKDEIECSNCGSYWNYCDNDTERFNFCPNCGIDFHPKED